MRRALAVVVPILVGSRAAADEPAPPRPVHLDAQLDGHMARFSVRYIERTARGLGDADGKSYALPARGLITAGTVTEGGKRHVLQLIDAKRATLAFDALWDTPPGDARRWVVMVQAEVFTRTFSITTAVPRAATLVVELTITAPTCFHRDDRYVRIPKEWLPRVPAAMHVPASALPEVEGGCAAPDHGVEMDTWMKFPARQLAARAPGADRVGTYAGRALLGSTNIVKLELGLAARVSETPRDLVTAIVVDGSRSTTTEQLEAQRETIAAYLRAAPLGRVQLIEYARHARALLPSWTTASQAAPRIDRELRAMRRKNGSNIEAGLREAGRWLDQTSGTRRIVLFTDENLSVRSEHTHAIDDALPANTLVHVVALGGEGLDRDDKAKLARIAAKTKGMSVRGGEVAIIDDKPVGKLDAMLLARPITLDHVRVRTPGWQSLGVNEHRCPESADDIVPTSLPEGTQCTWWGRGDAVSSPFVVEGFLWGARIERVVRADLARSLDVIRELSAMHVLDVDLQALAEHAARAVNTVWSLYGTWGGDGGYADELRFGRGGSGSSCGGCGGHLGGGSRGFGVLGMRPDLSIELTRIVQTCKPAQAVDVEVETTFEEIVDVTVNAVSADTRACVEAALWSSSLVVPGAPPRTITRFTVAPT